MLRLRMFLLDSDGEYLSVTLVFYCCVIYYHKRGSSKCHWSEVQHTVSGLSVQTEVKVTAGCVPITIWHQESFLKVTSVLGRIFLTAVTLKSSFLAAFLPEKCKLIQGKKWDN